MGFMLRTVVREGTGKAGVVIERYRLRAHTLIEAKREVDRGNWVRGWIEPNGFEIVDDSEAVLAQRSYQGKNVYAPWT